MANTDWLVSWDWCEFTSLLTTLLTWVKPWQEAFGWSRAEIGTAVAYDRYLILAAPLAGKLIDRYGLRLYRQFSLLYAFGLLAVSKMTGELWLYYVLAVS